VATNAVGELGSRSEELEYSCRLQVGNCVDENCYKGQWVTTFEAMKHLSFQRIIPRAFL
jgi:hypothetical protein